MTASFEISQPHGKHLVRSGPQPLPFKEMLHTGSRHALVLLCTQMGPHCVWSNDSSTDMEALRLDFPDSFPPESAEDDMHDTTPEVPIPCMAQLLEKEIKANEEAPVTPCRCAGCLLACIHH